MTLVLFLAACAGPASPLGSYDVTFGGDRSPGTLRLAEDGHYDYTPGDPTGDEAFYFVSHPTGSFRWDAAPNGSTLGTVHFDPEGEGYSPTDPRRNFLVWADGHRVFFHSLNSEFEYWAVSKP